MDIKKFPTAGTGNDVGSKVAHAPFYGSVVPWSQYTGRKEGCLPVICQFLIGAVCDRGLIFSVAQDADFQVIRGQDSGYASKISMHGYMGVDSVLFFHGPAGLCVAIHTERQGRNEQINLADVPCCFIIKRESGACPIDHKSVTRFMLDVHSELILRNVVLIQLGILGIAIRRLACTPAGIHVFFPQKL